MFLWLFLPFVFQRAPNRAGLKEGVTDASVRALAAAGGGENLTSLLIFRGNYFAVALGLPRELQQLEEPREMYEHWRLAQDQWRHLADSRREQVPPARVVQEWDAEHRSSVPLGERTFTWEPGAREVRFFGSWKTLPAC